MLLVQIFHLDFAELITKETVGILDIAFLEGILCFLIKAGMAQGKTTGLIKWLKYMIRLFRERGEQLRAVFPTNRIAQATSLLSVLKEKGIDARLYSEKRVFKDDCDFLICEYESLWKIPQNKLKVFNVVVLDEIRGTLGSIISSTNGDRISMNLETIIGLIRRASYVIGLDDDLEFDGLVKEFLSHVYGDYHRLQQVTVANYYTRTALTRSLEVISEAAWVVKVQCLADLRKRVGCTFRSRSKMIQVGAVLRLGGKPVYCQKQASREAMGHLKGSRTMWVNKVQDLGENPQELDFIRRLAAEQSTPVLEVVDISDSDTDCDPEMEEVKEEAQGIRESDVKAVSDEAPGKGEESTHAVEVVDISSDSDADSDQRSLPAAVTSLQCPDKCAICLSERTWGESSFVLPCFHSFCSGCIFDWMHLFEVRGAIAKCPGCRGPCRLTLRAEPLLKFLGQRGDLSRFMAIPGVDNIRSGVFKGLKEIITGLLEWSPPRSEQRREQLEKLLADQRKDNRNVGRRSRLRLQRRKDRRTVSEASTPASADQLRELIKARKAERSSGSDPHQQDRARWDKTEKLLLAELQERYQCPPSQAPVDPGDGEQVKPVEPEVKDTVETDTGDEDTASEDSEPDDLNGFERIHKPRLSLLAHRVWYVLERRVTMGVRELDPRQKKLLKRLRRRLPWAKWHPWALVISADTPDFLVSEILSNIDYYCERCLVFLSTTKLTVGTDIQTLFYALFFNCSYPPTLAGPPAREMLQNLGRFRLLLLTCITTTGINLNSRLQEDAESGIQAQAKAVAEVLDEIVNRMALRLNLSPDIRMQLAGGRELSAAASEPGGTDTMQWTPHHLQRFAAWIIHERQEDFATRLIEQCRRKNWPIQVHWNREEDEDESVSIARLAEALAIRKADDREVIEKATTSSMENTEKKKRRSMTGKERREG
jgi:hypothetical protein